MIKAIKALAAADVGIIVFCLLSGQSLWLINTQVGFITSAFVIFGSFMGYQKMVEARLQSGDVPHQKDVIDKLDDPHDLYGEDEQKHEDAASMLKEEKKRLKENKRKFTEVMKDSKAGLSIYRIASYGAFFTGFLYLSNQQLLHVNSYLFGVLSAPLLAIVFVWLFSEKNA